MTGPRIGRHDEFEGIYKEKFRSLARPYGEFVETPETLPRLGRIGGRLDAEKTCQGANEGLQVGIIDVTRPQTIK